MPTSDIKTAFHNIDVAVLVGAMPRREGMERKDLLKANVKIFKQQGEALEKYAKKTVKVNRLFVFLHHLTLLLYVQQLFMFLLREICVGVGCGQSSQY